jgi:hypothetical protein
MFSIGRSDELELTASSFIRGSLKICFVAPDQKTEAKTWQALPTDFPRVSGSEMTR